MSESSDITRLISRETQRLHRLVEDLLDFGRMEAGKKQYDMRPTEISTLVSQVVAELSEEHAARGFEIVIRGMSPGSVFGDADALNGRRAEPARKRGQILRGFAPGRRRGQELGRPRIRERAGLRHGHIPADLKRIFRKFERGAAAKASSIQGTGLGLAMVHGILRAHGGSVRVESEENRGSTFTLLIPCAATESGATGMPRVLIAEDEPGIALAVEDDLTLDGYEVEVVCDGDAASKRAAKDASTWCCSTSCCPLRPASTFAAKFAGPALQFRF